MAAGVRAARATWDARAMSIDRGSPAAGHRERLWPGPLGWASVLGFAGFVASALRPVDPAVAALAAALAAVGALAVAVVTSPVVEVGAGALRAGRARIPVSALGAVRVLDRAGVRATLGPGSDARTYACLRSWIPGAVEVRVVDPADPTPAWLISTRRPRHLGAAIDAARGVQAAHSEQIS